MARQIPDTFPTSIAEWPAFIDNAYEYHKEQYDAKVAEAKAQAKAQWDKDLPEKREKLINQAKINIDAEMIDSPDGPVSLTEKEKAQKLKEATKQIDAMLQEEEKQQLDMAASMIEQPPTREQIETQFAFGKPQEVVETFEEPTTTKNLSVYDVIWKSGDYYYEVSTGELVNPKSRAGIDQSRVVELACNNVEPLQNLRDNVLMYSQSDPRIKLGGILMTEDEKFAALRVKRAELLEEYDVKIMQLNRLIRENPEEKIYLDQRDAWDAYATSLANITAQDGAPWDGGGSETPWPVKP